MKTLLHAQKTNTVNRICDARQVKTLLIKICTKFKQRCTSAPQTSLSQQFAVLINTFHVCRTLFPKAVLLIQKKQNLGSCKTEMSVKL